MPNRSYTVKADDTWTGIASKVYGDPSLYTLIQSANVNYFLVTGEKLVIPPAPNRPSSGIADSLPGKGKDDVTLVIGGKEFEPESIRIYRSIDSATDAWSAILPWTDDPLLRPFRYSPAAVYIGSTLCMAGAVYFIGSSYTEDRRELQIEGSSFTADIVDSCIPGPQYQWGTATLEQHAKELLHPLGVDVEFEFPPGEAFITIDAEPNSKIFEHLAKLAFERELLVTSTPKGGLLFTKAKSGKIVGALTEGQSNVISWEGEFDGRKRYSLYRAYGYSPLAGDKAVIARDENVPRSRAIAFQVDDQLSYDISYSAEWKRSKQIAESLRIDLPIEGLYAPNGDLWQFNTLVSVTSPTLFIPDGFTFLIRSVEFEIAGRSKITIISLVPPGVYAKRGVRTVDPWA
jgi:prophage tail gpP-like protein